MLKWIGACLILSMSLYTGCAVAADEQKRVAELAALCRLTDAVGESVELLHMPADQIFLTYMDAALEDNGFLPRLRAHVWQYGPQDALGLVTAALLREGRLHLTEEDTTEWYPFSRDFGSGDCGQEVRRCAYCAKRLRTRLDAASSGMQAKIRVSRTLWLSGGILCVLLLF